jgi:ribose 5-phosphate isomerase RpiB
VRVVAEGARMRIAVVNEASSADKNAAVVAALEGRGHQVLNIGMTGPQDVPALSYVHTGLITGILLTLGRVDLVVGGCGTGQGYAMAAMMYPNVFCGQVTNALDAWLFAQINGGNCISLQLNQGFGWAGDVNLRMIFDAFFSVESGGGYPSHRREAQRTSRQLLKGLSAAAHRSFADSIAALPDELLHPVLCFPGVEKIIDIETIEDEQTRSVFRARARAASVAYPAIAGRPDARGRKGKEVAGRRMRRENVEWKM